MGHAERKQHQGLFQLLQLVHPQALCHLQDQPGHPGSREGLGEGGQTGDTLALIF